MNNVTTDTGKKRPLKIVILIILVLVAVYALSVYTRKHETKDLPTPTTGESPLKGDGNLR